MPRLKQVTCTTVGFLCRLRQNKIELRQCHYSTPIFKKLICGTRLPSFPGLHAQILSLVNLHNTIMINVSPSLD